MADPRGHGFKRGHGKWHEPTPTVITPATYGWQPLRWNKEHNLQVWHIGDIKLMAHPQHLGGNDWLVQVDGSEMADHWKGHLETITEKVLTDYTAPGCDECGTELASTDGEYATCLDCRLQTLTEAA